jgi:hypothetical protein
MKRHSLALAVLCVASLSMSALTWQSHLRDELSLLGHRNWILVVDSAYPEQVGPGIETVETNADQLDVVRTVLTTMKSSIHVRPVIFMDAELPFVTDGTAPGVSAYRTQIASCSRAMKSNRVSTSHSSTKSQRTEHNTMSSFSKLAVPYTSVFIHLDCKYWSAENERDLRAKMSSRASQ